MEVHEDIREMKREIRLMADQSALLTSIADGLRGLGAAVATLRDENITLRARNAELEGEDVAESAATDTVKTEFD
ncbi:MAG: hypothetical protein M3N43_04870, partial [Actinomycetota bacterium]|nr:hypothetical protein [Actinomycetota bacterium]